MSEKLSTPETPAQRLDAVLDASVRSAKRREKQFWALSLLWVATVLVVAQYFRSQVTRFDRQQTLLKGALVDQLQRTKDLNRDNQTLQNAFERLETRLHQNLTSRERQQYALVLAEAHVARNSLSDQERKLLISEAAAARDKKVAESLYLQAAELWDDNRGSAIAKLQAALQQNPKYRPARAALGEAYSDLSKNEESVQHFTQALTLKEDAFGYAGRCWPLIVLSRLKEALADCQKATALDARYWAAYNYAGFAHYQLKQDKEAEDAWRQAARLSAQPESSLENLGLIYSRSGSWQKALDNAETLKLSPDSSWNWLFLWIAADKLGQKSVSAQARSMWLMLKSSDDVDTLKPFLVPVLHAYLEAR